VVPHSGQRVTQDGGDITTGRNSLLQFVQLKTICLCFITMRAGHMTTDVSATAMAPSGIDSINTLLGDGFSKTTS